MTRTLRLFVVAVSCSAIPSCGPTVKLAASPGETPALDANPFTPTGPPTLGSATMTSKITVESVGKFSGPVTLSTECCQDVVRDRWVSRDPAVHFVSSFGINPISVTSGGTPSVTLGIVVQSGSFPLPTSPTTLSTGSLNYGKHVLKVVAKDSAGKVLDTTNVGVRVLPRIEPDLGCTSGVDILPLATVVAAQVVSGEATPRKATTTVAVYKGGATAPGSTAWPVEIVDDPNRPVDTATVVLRNRSTSKRKAEIRSCSATSNFVRADPDLDSVTMILDKAKDRTLILKQEVCVTFTCIVKMWKEVAVFAEPAFWSVFGGKKVTITWMGE